MKDQEVKLLLSVIVSVLAFLENDVENASVLKPSSLIMEELIIWISSKRKIFTVDDGSFTRTTAIGSSSMHALQITSIHRNGDLIFKSRIHYSIRLLVK